MPPNPDIRASDADRDRTAASLREHCAQGRITMDELQERLDDTYKARTIGDLLAVTDDLPEEDLHELPVPARTSYTGVPAKREPGALARTGPRSMWAVWAAVGAVNIGIWMILALAGNVVYPWWIWVIGPWGVLLAAGSAFGPRKR
ncbi:DUF1707 domain-containing protein [Spirillospora sp. CA-294931]|uniref:DUF1707 SHOCT-like domain-containing protein n=1 Tax=Spirillospora sp. CA-294931 TaxID=3240042 RepID=UPI003D8C8C8B